MELKINKNQAGTMVLKDGSNVNYGAIRLTEKTFTYYTGKGLREMFKPSMTEKEKQTAEALKKLTERELTKQGYIAEVAVADILQIN
jgi:hypothetical protein